MWAKQSEVEGKRDPLLHYLDAKLRGGEIVDGEQRNGGVAENSGRGPAPSVVRVRLLLLGSARLQEKFEPWNQLHTYNTVCKWAQRRFKRIKWHEPGRGEFVMACFRIDE